MKLTGAVLLMVCGTLTGILQAQKIQYRRRICRELKMLCEALSAAVSFRADSVITLLNELLVQQDYRHLSFISADNIRRRLPVESPLKAEENEALSSFLFSLGKSDLNSQKQAVRGFGSYIAQAEEEYAQRYRHDARLFICLGFFGTSLLLLLII